MWNRQHAHEPSRTRLEDREIAGCDEKVSREIEVKGINLQHAQSNRSERQIRQRRDQ